MLGTDPDIANSYPTMQMLKNSMKSKDMAWGIVNNVVVKLHSSPDYSGVLEVCLGDCFRLHAKGWATEWFVLKGDLPDCVQPDDLLCLEAFGGDGFEGDYEWLMLESVPGVAKFTSPPAGPDAKQVWVLFEAPGDVTISATKRDDEWDVECKGGHEFKVLILNLAMDANRDGTIDDEPGGPDDVDKDVWEYGADKTGAIIRVNNDDDDGSGIDAFDDFINGPDDVDDITPIHIRRLGTTLPAGWRVVLRVEGGDPAQRSVRIFPARTPWTTSVIEPTGPHEYEIPATDIEGTGPPLEYGIEAVRYPGWPEPAFDGLVMLVLELQDETGAACRENRVQVRVAPWMMPSHLDTVTEVYVTDTVGVRLLSPPWPPGCGLPGAPDCIEVGTFPTRLAAALDGTGVPLHPAISSGDRWVQDQWEIGFHSAPSGWQSVLLNSPRGGTTLRLYAENNLLTSDFGIYGSHLENPPLSSKWTTPPDTNDSFGNLEVLPPYNPAVGNSLALGRIYHGSGMQADVTDFLNDQVVQTPRWPIDTSWLVVKHVDEFISVQATGPDTFRVILASPQMAIDILTQLAFDDFVFEHGQLWHPTETRSAEFLLNHEPDSVGSPDFTIRDFNEQVQTKIAVVREELLWLGIDFVEIPAYFFTPAAVGAPADWPAQAALPDMVNMLNVNGTLIVPDPNPHPGITWPAWFGSDPFKQAFMSAVGSGTTVEWIDCMEYHYNQGEVHCGTNVRRTPRPEIREWWLHGP